MRKKVGIIKRVFCISLIFLLSINSFAAIVSDNDGSAFITKSEFDALKSSFQAQIDTYNQSIDSKIDGAIASYLAGIKMSTVIEVDSLINKYSITGTQTVAGSDIVNNVPLWFSGQTGSTSETDLRRKLAHGNEHQYATWNVGEMGFAVSNSNTVSKTASGWSWMSAPEEKRTRRIFVDNSNIATGLKEFGINIMGLWIHNGTHSYSNSSSTVTDSTFGIDASFVNGYGVRNGTCGVHKKVNDVGAARQDTTLLFTHDYIHNYYDDTFAPLQPLNEQKEYTAYDDDTKSNVTLAKSSLATLDYGWKTEACPSTLPNGFDQRLGSSNVLFKVTGARFHDQKTVTFKGVGPDIQINQIVWKELQDLCIKNGPARNGLALCKLDYAGNLKVDFNIDSPGFVIMWIGDDPEPTWGGNYNSKFNNDKWFPAGDNSINLSVAEAGKYVFVIYLPTNSSKQIGYTGRLKTNSIQITKTD